MFFIEISIPSPKCKKLWTENFRWIPIYCTSFYKVYYLNIFTDFFLTCLLHVQVYTSEFSFHHDTQDSPLFSPRQTFTGHFLKTPLTFYVLKSFFVWRKRNMITHVNHSQSSICQARTEKSSFTGIGMETKTINFESLNLL